MNLLKTISIIVGAVALAASSIEAQSCRDPLEGSSYATAATQYPTLRKAIETVAQQQIGQWFTDSIPTSKLASAAQQLFLPKCQLGTSTPVQNDAPPTVVVYGLPNKDCEAGFSNQGLNKNQNDYRNWLQNIVNAAGSKPVIYILEPDAIGLLANGGCAVSSGYADNLAMALQMLGQNSNAQIYMDVGYWTILYSQSDAAKVARMVESVDRDGRCKGIALNTSNYRPNSEMQTACKNFKSGTSRNYSCIVDTSRNGVMPPSTAWCNVKGTGMGTIPTRSTGISELEWYVWIKPPGESDGQCSGQGGDSLIGPNAGAFFPDHFVQLWNNGVFVREKGYPQINMNSPPSSWPVTTPSTPPPTPPPTTTTRPPTPPPTTTTTRPPTSPPTPPPTPPTTPAPSGQYGFTGLACNYQGQVFRICRNANAWSYENGAVCVGISRCVTQSPPYGVFTAK